MDDVFDIQARNYGSQELNVTKNNEIILFACCQILQSYLEDMFNGDVISSSRRPLGPINLPPTGAGFREFIDLINQLSDEDRPAMFGLPANIQQVRQ